MTEPELVTEVLNAGLDEDEARLKRGQPIPWTTDMTKRAYLEVEAKRKILAEYTRVVEFRKSYPERYYRGSYYRGLYESGLEVAVTHLAAVYADHPDDEAAGVDCCDNHMMRATSWCELPAGHDGPHHSVIEWGP
jgi:hypothetical protein